MNRDDDRFPEYSYDAALANKGRRLVENIVHDSFGWLFREVAKDDLGIDAQIEVIRESGKSQGRLFAMQIKCGPSYLKETTDQGYVYRGKLEHLNYWINYSLPVLLVLCDPEKGIRYWVQIAPANVERLSVGWKVLVPYAQTLTPEHKMQLELVVNGPQADDVLPLALHKLLIEKSPHIVIAQELETPHDFWGFDFLAKLEGHLILIKYLYKPIEPFVSSDIDEVLRRLDKCATGCGWNVNEMSLKILLFFVAHSRKQLELEHNLVAYMSRFPEIAPYRAVCDFHNGVSLIELDSNNEYIDVYDHDAHQPDVGTS